MYVKNSAFIIGNVVFLFFWPCIIRNGVPMYIKNASDQDRLFNCIDAPKDFGSLQKRHN